MKKSLDEIRSGLREHQTLIRNRFRVPEMLFFGSYARQKQTERSDVDILIPYEKAPTLWMLAELRDYFA